MYYNFLKEKTILFKLTFKEKQETQGSLRSLRVLFFYFLFIQAVTRKKTCFMFTLRFI